MAAMLTGQQAKFCAAYAVDQNGTAAYLTASPGVKRTTARANAARWLALADIQAEIARIRSEAERDASGAVSILAAEFLSAAEKRAFCARVVRAKIGELPHDSDLFEAVESTEFGWRYKLPRKLDAIKTDNDLAGEGSEAESADALSELLERIMK